LEFEFESGIQRLALRLTESPPPPHLTPHTHAGILQYVRLLSTGLTRRRRAELNAAVAFDGHDRQDGSARVIEESGSRSIPSLHRHWRNGSVRDETDRQMPRASRIVAQAALMRLMRSVALPTISSGSPCARKTSGWFAFASSRYFCFKTSAVSLDRAPSTA